MVLRQWQSNWQATVYSGGDNNTEQWLGNGHADTPILAIEKALQVVHVHRHKYAEPSAAKILGSGRLSGMKGRKVMLDEL